MPAKLHASPLRRADDPKTSLSWSDRCKLKVLSSTLDTFLHPHAPAYMPFQRSARLVGQVAAAHADAVALYCSLPSTAAELACGKTHTMGLPSISVKAQLGDTTSIIQLHIPVPTLKSFLFRKPPRSTAANPDIDSLKVGGRLAAPGQRVLVGRRPCLRRQRRLAHATHALRPPYGRPPVLERRVRGRPLRRPRVPYLNQRIL